MRLIMVGLCCLGLGVAPAAWAEGTAGHDEPLTEVVERLRRTVERLATTVESQQRRIAELEAARPQAPVQRAAAAPAGVAPRPVTASLSAFNQEIGVVADVVGQLSES